VGGIDSHILLGVLAMGDNGIPSKIGGSTLFG
jgi:hypothetical protein